ncbi:MAG: AEC family transporter [Rhizobiaceae bacterium]|nr:AEC family transporter [Rhizobiaceae bacterium]
MLEILFTILPVFIIMATGYGAVKIGYLKSEISDSLNTITVRFAVPVLLFRAIYNLDFKEAIQWPMLAGFYLGATLSFVITILIARVIFKRRPGEAVAVGFFALFSNTVLIVVPLAERAFGPEILPLVFGIIAFHAPSLYAIGMVTMEFARSDGRSVGKTLNVAARSIFANPLMIGILLGAFLNQISLPLPLPVTAAIDMIANAAIPIALIGIGAALTRYKIKSEMSETALVTVMSLIIHPAIALFFTHYLLGLPQQFVQAAVIIAAMPPGMNIYIYAVMYNRAVALSASAIVVATFTSIFTLFGWLWLLSTLW